MYDYQIVGNLDKMAHTQLLSLSSSHTTSTEEFIARTKSFSQEQGMQLQQCSQRIECSVQELLALLKDHANLSPPQPNDSKEVTQAKKGTENGCCVLDL